MVKGPSIPEMEKPASGIERVTSDVFTALLKALGDGESAGTHYENLRAKLILFFSRRLLQFPEDLADEVLDRLAFRLSRGTQIDFIDGFALGIARHVAMEQIKNKTSFQPADEMFFHNVPAISATQSRDEDIVRMERCLKKLPSGEARLVKSYYLLPSGDHIQARKDLAETLGITAIALRQRVFQIRQKLRNCVSKQAQERKK